MSVDVDQLLLDHDELHAILRRVLRSRREVDQHAAQVVSLTRQLREAKRLHKEAGWKLGAAERAAEERTAKCQGQAVDPALAASVRVIVNGRSKT